MLLALLDVLRIMPVTNNFVKLQFFPSFSDMSDKLNTKGLDLSLVRFPLESMDTNLAVRHYNHN